MSEFMVQLPPLSLPVVGLILEGLSQLPLGRSRDVHDRIEAEAERQVAAQREQMVIAAVEARKATAKKPRKPKAAQDTTGS
jgi:hypothetical protein